MKTASNATFVYEYNGGLYVNLTNQCTNACIFCVRNGADGVGNNHLWLTSEPAPTQVIDALGAYAHHNKVTFCGFGEPTMRLTTLIKVAKHLKQMGMLVKINTNGQGSVFNDRDILPELVGIVDEFSVSLNAANAQNYQQRCNSCYGKAAYASILDFAQQAVTLGFKTTLTVLDDIPRHEIEACRKITDDIGATFRVRHRA